MNRYRSSRTMATDADIVLNTAGDPARGSSWLPDDVAEISAHPDEHEVRWRPADRDGWSGRLRATDQGVGSSQVELEIWADRPAGDGQRVADRALAGLAAEVEQNFNAG